jgi:hypothetical protein
MADISLTLRELVNQSEKMFSDGTLDQKESSVYMLSLLAAVEGILRQSITDWKAASEAIKLIDFSSFRFLLITLERNSNHFQLICKN